ncbi:glycosyltransferase family 2 protein [Algoriphagus aquimarinus]|uniref:Glycosyltransferase involved in cell wall bisynthesis n=1 Tax=Algoriphagus aquimarinus TaxID=237018 RepID=A0A1I1AMM9_9BACT|nr:glycosyltransferase family 2 protein [Algoriphagus aquimarinus]SFB37573.1 Glycosyltransferase involved in cell wall bisynthesis [Algoriphagus aquimarinus]
MITNDSARQKSSTPVVSICVQTYQHEKFIAQCLDSLLSQKTDFDFEIIVGEDGSSDRTGEICDLYAKNHPDKIRLFKRDPKNKISIRGKKTGRFNFLENLKAARGKYICLCDGDDYWSNDQKLQKQYQFLNENPEISLVYSSYIHQKKDLKAVVEPVQDKIFEPEQLKTIHYLGHVSTWMFRNDLQSLFSNPIIYKAFAMDMVLFAYFKIKGKIAGQSFTSSFYRYNTSGMFRSKRKTETARDFAMIHFYFFRYIHTSLYTFLTSGSGYFIKKYLKTIIRI